MTTPTKPRYVPTPEQAEAQRKRREAQQAQRAQRVETGTAQARAKPAEVLAHEASKFKLSRTWPISAGGAAAAVGGAHYLHGRQKQNGPAGHGRRATNAAVGAGAAGGAATTTYHMGGKAAKIGIQNYRTKHWDKAKHNPIWADHQRSFGIKPGSGAKGINDMPFNNRVKFYEKYPTSLPGGRAQRMLAIKNRRSVGAAFIGGSAVIGAARGGRDVNKALRVPAPLHPRQLIGNNWARAGAATAGVGAAGHVASTHGDSAGTRRRGDEVSSGALGAALGQAAYQAPAAAHQQLVRGRNVPRYMRRDVKQSELSPEHKPLKRQYEKERRAWKAQVRDRGMTNAEGYRIYPKHWPNARAERLQGWTHAGRTGQVVGASATAAGAALEMRHSRRKAAKAAVGKASGLVYEHDKTSKVRAAELAAGIGALALGGPRLKMVGAASARGVRAAGQGRAPRALVQAESSRRAWLTGSKPAYDRLPPQFQHPGLLAAGGALAIADAVPVTRKTYTPVRGAY